MVGVALLLVLFGGAARPALPSRPSDRSCLIAWNAPSNHANRKKLASASPPTGIALHGGTVGTDTWTKQQSTQTAAKACLLMLRRTGTMQVVTGKWSFGRVDRWTWGHVGVTANAVAIPPNVRLLSDGRLTKIYNR